MSLQTADPVEARIRSALLSARFAVVKRRLAEMFRKDRDFLTGREIADLMRAELENELARAVAGSLENEPHAPHMAGHSRIVAEAYAIAARTDRPTTLLPEDEAALLARGFDPVEADFVRQDLEGRCLTDELDDENVSLRLEHVGAPINAATVEHARALMLRARASAHQRATRMFDPRVQSSPDPIATLLGAEFDPDRSLAGQTTARPASGAGAPDDCQFLIYDGRRFSEVIDDLVDQLKREGTWNNDVSQQRRIARTFCWITGDKELGRYNHLDVDIFKAALNALPKSFKFGSFQEGAMSRPFAEVIAEIPTPMGAERRSLKTVNRDMSFMSTIAGKLAKTAWRPKVPNTKVLDFSSATVAIKDRGVDTRPPWRSAHMALLFSSPVYTGGGFALRRLHRTAHPVVHHDAAYYSPLFWYYLGACREEICGMAVEEVVLDAPIPYIRIEENDIRGRDGEKAGEKRMARKRALPIHPEIMRLGFGDYVRAVAAEGHRAVFPELYLNDQKRGGGQLYNVAWRHIFAWIEARMAVPTGANGKGPDIHSIRALHASFYEVDGVSEIVRADVMGHARQGTNAKHYSKRMQTEGIDVIIRERLEFIERYIPVITHEVPAAPLSLLPIGERSRLGSGVIRKIRSDRKA